MARCPGVPFVKGNGIFIGPESVVDHVFMPIPAYYDDFSITVFDVFGEGDRVAMMGFYQGTNKASGKSFKAPVAHFWKVKNDRITHFFQALDTVSMAG